MTNPYANNGGKRRRHVAPKLDADMLKQAKLLKESGLSRRKIAAILGVASETMNRAFNHQGAYVGSGL